MIKTILTLFFTMFLTICLYSQEINVVKKDSVVTVNVITEQKLILKHRVKFDNLMQVIYWNYTLLIRFSTLTEESYATSYRK